MRHREPTCKSGDAFWWRVIAETKDIEGIEGIETQRARVQEWRGIAEMEGIECIEGIETRRAPETEGIAKTEGIAETEGI